MNIAEYNAESLRIALDTICRIGEMCGGTRDVFCAVQRVINERDDVRALVTEYFAAKDAVEDGTCALSDAAFFSALDRESAAEDALRAAMAS